MALEVIIIKDLGVAERWKTARLALGLTQEQLAERLHIGQNTISKYESGANAIKDPMIMNFCNEFGISFEYLKNGIGPMFECDQSLIDALVSKYNLPTMAKIILEQWIRLTPQQQAVISEYMDRCIEAAQVGQVVEMTSFPFQAVARGAAGETEGVAEVNPDEIMRGLAAAEAESAEESNKL